MANSTGNEPRAFKVDARALLSLGRESIKDNTTALVELIKNCYDADAANVEVEIHGGPDGEARIRVADDGTGMASEDIDRKWLRIGFSEKRQNRVSPKGRRETGEKGIGRLSADRLGAVLELRSKKQNDRPVGVLVDWDLFDVEDTDIHEVAVSELAEPQPVINARDQKSKALPNQGTEVRISKLRQLWSGADVEKLRVELATLVPPGARSEDFKIWLRTGREEFELVESAFDAVAALEFTGRFDSNGRLSYSISSKPLGNSNKRHTAKTGKIDWEKLVHPDREDNEGYAIGRLDVSLAFYLRSGANLAGGLSLNQLREYLDSQGGIRIYRDGIRVKPYGDPAHPEGDWLGLAARKTSNPAGAGRDDYRMSANQLVGSVSIGRDSNPTLSDSAAREGLIHGDGYDQLKEAVYACILLLESAYHESYVAKKVEAETDEPVGGPIRAVEEIKTALSNVRRELVDAVAQAPKDATSKIRDSVALLTAVSFQVDRAEREIEELASQATIYRGLATVGISSAVFGHETESALSQARLSCAHVADLVEDGDLDVKVLLEELHKADRAMDRVAMWGKFALTRVKKDKRRRTKIDIATTVQGVVSEVAPLFRSSGIVLETNISGSLEIRAFPMDVEAMVLNLLANAFYFARRSKRQPAVEVGVSYLRKLVPPSLEIRVADSGPGIPKAYIDQIWRPLFSTRVDDRGKPSGTGLGLTIVKSVADDLGARLLVDSTGHLGGASFAVVIPGGART